MPTGVPSPELLDDLSQEISGCWHSVGTHLHVPQAKLKSIAANNTEYHGPSQKAFAMLMAWIDEGRTNLFGELANALNHLHLGALAQKYCGTLEGTGIPYSQGSLEERQESPRKRKFEDVSGIPYSQDSVEERQESPRERRFEDVSGQIEMMKLMEERMSFRKNESEMRKLRLRFSDYKSEYVKPMRESITSLRKETYLILKLLDLTYYGGTWEDLVHAGAEWNVPAAMHLKSKLNVTYSPTEELFKHVEARRPRLTIADLTRDLMKAGRGDIVRLIEGAIPGAMKSKAKVRDNKSRLVRAIAFVVDEKSECDNWYNLGRELGLKQEDLDDLKHATGPDLSNTNPSFAVMEFIYATKPDITLNRFKGVLKNLNRPDALLILDGLSKEKGTQKMTQAIPLDSTFMADICSCLNRYGGWERLARSFKVPQEAYQDFKPSSPQSPTKLLFEWYAVNRPELTVGQLFVALQKIGRDDVISALKESSQEQFAQAKE